MRTNGYVDSCWGRDEEKKEKDNKRSGAERKSRGDSESLPKLYGSQEIHEMCQEEKTKNLLIMHTHTPVQIENRHTER